MLFFKCDYCGSTTPPGVSVCNRPLCKEKEATRQSVLKCRELGIPFRPELFKPYPGGP